MREIVPRFQPIVDTWQNQVIGFEATIQGVHGESAQALFERATSQERVVDLDFQARNLALQSGLPMLKNGQRLFLNVTPDTVQQHLDAFLTNVPLNQVVLEITEQMPIRIEMGRLREELQSWCDQGLQVALDDFGHGFTNVEMITELPLSYIKLDKVFAASVHRSKTAETVKWLVRMSQDAGIRFVVEGVETAEQRERLMDLGVRYMQGFSFWLPEAGSCSSGFFRPPYLMGRGLGALEKFLRLWSPLGIIEIAYTIMPWWALAAAASFFWNSRWLDAVTVVGAVYLLSSTGLIQTARWWSRHTLGLRRYIVVPIPRWLAVALIRGRMALPAGRRYFLLHVRVEQGVDLRRMAREMAGDVHRAVESEWASGAVFIGCTFGRLGTRQKRLLEEYGEVVAVPGTFLPGQTWLMRPAKYQKRMFGRARSRGQWRVVKFTPHEGKGEGSEW